jgi:hypothetical protein
MKPFQDTHPGGPETLPFGSEAALPAQPPGGASMRLLGVLLGGLFALMHGYVLITHGAIDGMALTRQPESSWLLPWHGLWFLLACLGWLGLVGITLQSWDGVLEDQTPGLRWLVLAGLLSCVAALLPWWMAPAAKQLASLGPIGSAIWLCLPLPFWLGWLLRFRALHRARAQAL